MKNNVNIIIIYTVGFFVALFLAHCNILLRSLISTLIFGCLFEYDVIHNYGRYSYYEIFGCPKDLFIVSLVSLLWLFSFACLLVNISSFLNIQ